jgi:hypothetical protein
MLANQIDCVRLVRPLASADDSRLSRNLLTSQLRTFSQEATSFFLEGDSVVGCLQSEPFNENLIDLDGNVSHRR